MTKEKIIEEFDELFGNWYISYQNAPRSEYEGDARKDIQSIHQFILKTLVEQRKSEEKRKEALLDEIIKIIEETKSEFDDEYRRGINDACERILREIYHLVALKDKSK